MAIVGANGAGKTTLFNALTGFVPLERGQVMLGETDLAGVPLVGVVGPNGAGKTSLLSGIAGLHRTAGGRVLFGGSDISAVESSNGQSYRSDAKTAYGPFAQSTAKAEPRRVTAAMMFGEPASGVVVIIGSGLVMLLQLSGNWKSMWCSDFGLVAGFKMAVVGIALTIGAVNNRVVAYQKHALDSPGRRFRPRRERSIPKLRRLVAVEAAVLGVAVLFSGALGETELPAVFEGNYYPLDLQETVRPGLFGSGCQQ